MKRNVKRLDDYFAYIPRGFRSTDYWNARIPQFEDINIVYGLYEKKLIIYSSRTLSEDEKKLILIALREGRKKRGN
ncbi:MAG: hypothetical protein AABY22_11575 [Nanoarchaeota archaeon]